MKTATQSFIFRSLDISILGFLILIFVVFFQGGVDCHWYGLHLSIRLINYPFLIMLGLSFLKLYWDPACSELRKFFVDPSGILSWRCLVIGALSAGLFFWFCKDPRNIQGLFTINRFQWKCELSQYLQFYVVLFHFIWLFFSNAFSGKASYQIMDILKLDAHILGFAILAPILCLLLVHTHFDQAKTLFLIGISVFSLMVVLEAVLWANVSWQNKLLDLEF